MKNKTSVPILVVDDDREDCEMIREAFVESRLSNKVDFVHDGTELIDYLSQRLDSTDLQFGGLPGLILLDLNMPKMDGREVLRELKMHPRLHQIPIVVLTTSQAEEDIVRSYNLGANSFITKPVGFSALVDVMRNLGRYWFEIVELPDRKRDDQ
ncbi:MAG: response regulator [Bdellovibrionales bacterium]|nr:response regulator [Bdellovibrionales bacterium]